MAISCSNTCNDFRSQPPDGGAGVCRSVRRLLPFILVALVAGVAQGQSTTETETETETEIRSLIEAVGASGCDFERNGTSHSATEAAAHLTLKYQRGQRYANSAEEFIERLASKSSWTGRPYQMICDGEAQPAGDWLSATLAQLRAQ